MRCVGSLRSSKKWAAVAIVLAFACRCGPLFAQADPASKDAGAAVFARICFACHTIGRGKLVGPDLQGITERREAAWLKVHIKTPSVHHAQGDPIAKENLAAFGLPMPDPGLQDPEVDAVIAFLDTGAAPAATRPPLFIPVVLVALLLIVAFTTIGLTAGKKQLEVKA